ncbi:NEL-type E3 ubiquitin ligase domain-containing protein [Pseudomonas rhodesiae]|uniref:NEL-type E3 ubiquitin ligase domain-containing protein n=1 Tax=Pseudomonas rhodesiae TaxID=76760 RepID=UPI0032B1DB03
MTDLLTDPLALSDVDEPSPHVGPIQDNTPAWYTDALAGRKTELANLKLVIPPWYTNADSTAKDRLKAVHDRSRTSLNQLDQWFSQLKSPADYAEPLLVAAIEEKFGLRLDVTSVFYARKMEQRSCSTDSEELSTTTVSSESSLLYFYKGVSLLEAALMNFTEDDASKPICLDCRLITRYNFHQYSSAKKHAPASVKSLRLSIKPNEFAALCRTLDLGQSYYEHVRGIINAPILAKPPGALTGKLYSTLITAHRNQLELAAEIALMQGHIQPQDHRLIQAILIQQTGHTWAEDDVSFSPLQLCTVVIEQVLIIGPVVWQPHPRNATILPRPCMVYIPGDPLHPLKAYDNLTAFVDHLTTRLCRADYRTFFSQFVPLSRQEVFFTKLKALLDPDEVYTATQNFDPALKARLHRQGTYAPPWRDVWIDSAQQRVRSIMENAQASAVSTQEATDHAEKAWLWSWGKKILDVLNVAAFVVPYLGEVMLIVAAVQMVDDVAEGIQAWSEGDARAVWAHFSAVGLNLAGLAVPAALAAFKETAFIKRLVHVDFGGRSRLFDFDPTRYTHSISLPAELKPNSLGLYEHQGATYLPSTHGGHYKVQAIAEGDFRLVHPDGDARYWPRVRHNGAGAWVHEFEQPLTWDRKTLLRRLGPSVDAFSDAQLEQVRALSGVTDEQLRRVYVDQQLPPPLFREALRRFESARRYQGFIDRLSSTDPAVFGRVDWNLQMRLLLDSGKWPEARVLVALDADGDIVWRSAAVAQRSQVVKLDLAQVATRDGVILPSLLSQLSEEQIRHLLDEPAVERALRYELMLTGRIDSGFLATAADKEYADRLVERMMSEQRTPQARALRYRDRLRELAQDSKARLFGLEIAAGDVSSEANVQLLQRDFPGLPKLIAEDLLAHATDQELARMGETSRVPLRLAEEARRYGQKVRALRAHTDLLFDNELTPDSVRLALHKLATLPGRLDGVGLELRANTYDGELLDRVGRADAPRQLRLVRISLNEWKLFSGPDDLEYWRSDKDAFYTALWRVGYSGRTDWRQLKASTQALKEQLAQQPLSEEGTRQALSLQAIKRGFKSPMRLADGRFGYPLSPLGGAGRRPFICTMKAMYLYPSKSLEEVEALYGLQGLTDAQVLARLSSLEEEYNQLKQTLDAWHQDAEPGHSHIRRRVAGTIMAAWQRQSPQAYAADQTSIGHILDLSDEPVGELPPITANMDHVGSLDLRRMGLSDGSLPFLNAFGRLRWLNMRENNLTQLPAFANGGAGLTKLNLSRNDLQLTDASRARLEGMRDLKILNLSDNRRLGWTADLRGMRSLNQLYLADTGTTTFPAGAEQLTSLARIDLHSNQITTLPDYAYQHLDRINVHENPLSAATRERLGLEAPVDPAQWADHVTVDEARTLWLREVPAAEQTHRARLWDDVKACPDSAALFTVLADTTRSAEYASPVTRAALTQRVWDLLEAASQSQAIRESLFGIADDRVTCGDGSTVEFMNLESELLALKALEQAGEADSEGSLISIARQLFRLTLVDAVAEQDVASRGPGFTEQVEVILAYRIGLADRLGLPINTREMLFPQQANVSQQALDSAYRQVLRNESVIADESAFFVGREFWEKHLRSRYPQELQALMGPGIEMIEEKSSALFELSDVQGEQDTGADLAAQADWQSRHDAAVDRLARLLGKSKDDILVDGAMPSAFFDGELKQLAAARQQEQTQALQRLTRKVLNNFMATEGTSV